MHSSSDSFPEAFASAIIVAGGSGHRMDGVGGGVRKQYLQVAGVPVLLRAVLPFVDHPAVAQVVVVLPADDLSAPPEWLLDQPLTLVAGGSERGDSVWNGLLAVREESEVVLIHDGARPFVSTHIIDNVLEQCLSTGAVPTTAVTDTIKVADAAGMVSGTADRSRLWHAQTPQGFPRKLLIEAYHRSREEGWTCTDDASVFERAGFPVRIVAGAAENLKITRAMDLEMADLLARGLRRR
ncbi:2-C-methyl-D-erythritol 4-phosphate cytidylyltransferase [soil metagenome]